jgi:hypothetical protein
MLTLAREGASRLGRRNSEWCDMDAEAPDLPAHTLQAIVCHWG